MNFNRFEHINLTVRDLEASQQFYQLLFPDWYVRAEGVDGEGDRWIHLGDDQFYLALSSAPQATRTQQPYEGISINHVGFVVKDGEALRSLLEAHHLDYYTGEAPETRLRLYVSDPDGNEIELVEYQPSYALR
ncbi:MAG: VOC family protein [Oculatellaceae cyanobacterium Prado106]|jgi:catechol 2,3-dioxygenase-like lactoylglutathione lyase family enzyme|nr:VOC family protein [Oculatellaceae cyanobacterium Prado106]